MKNFYINFYMYIMMTTYYILSPALLCSLQATSGPKNAKGTMEVC